MWGAKLYNKDVSDPIITFLHCPFNLLRLFKDASRRSKIEIILDHSSDADLFPTLTSRMAEGNDRSASQSILVADFLNKLFEIGPSQDSNFRITLVRVQICKNMFADFLRFRINLVRVLICIRTSVCRKQACLCRKQKNTVRKQNSHPSRALG